MPPTMQQPRACGTLDTTRRTNLLLKPLEFPHGTSIDTCYGVFTSAANSALEITMETINAVTSTPTRNLTPTPSSTQRYVHIKQWPQRGKRDSPTSCASRPRRSSSAKNESPSGSCTHATSTPSRQTQEATSSTKSCQH
jgi:hypothetical protein